MTIKFPAPLDADEQEEGMRFAPKFDTNGLLTAVVTDHDTGELLMVAHMNREALARTLDTGNVWFWSRSRQQLWLKGETSGALQTVVEARVDCDQDSVWLKVRRKKQEETCHTGRISCFYRRITKSNDELRLEPTAPDPVNSY